MVWQVPVIFNPNFPILLAQLAGDRTVLLSTHIVEDIAQTRRHLAVLDAGRPVFRGTVAELTATADGGSGPCTPPGPQPSDGVIVSAVPDSGGVRYRVVAATSPPPTRSPSPRRSRRATSRCAPAMPRCPHTPLTTNMFKHLSGPAVDGCWLVVESDFVRCFFSNVIVTVGAVVPGRWPSR